MDHSDAEHVEPTGDAGLELVGPYTLIAKIASGDFTSVHLAQKDGALGFNRLAAIKRLKPSFAKQPEWTQLLLDEARLSAVVRHPNIVDILDVGTDAGIYIVMEYVEGADLDVLIGRAGKERHPRYLVPPIVDALTGLHAVHTAHDELGESLSMVHQAPRARHILIGIDGVSRITDFSQVSARGLIPSTLRGKRLAPGYMAPEQVLVSEPVSPRTDVFIAGITLWETLTGARLFHADTPALARRAITERHIPRPSEVGLKPPRAFDDICMRALQRNPEQRYQSALEMAQELRDVALGEALYASAGELGQWVRALASRALVERRRALGADEPSQEIPLPAAEARAPAVQVAFTNSAPPAPGRPSRPSRDSSLPGRDSLYGSSAPMAPSAVGAWPHATNTAVSRAPEPDAPIAEDHSRVSRSAVPVAPPMPVGRSAPRTVSKSTLMGISPQARPSTPPSSLGATHDYQGQSHRPASHGSASHGAASYDEQGYDARSRESSAFLGMTVPPQAAVAPKITRARRSAGLSGTLIGSKPNATLPEGALLQDMKVGSRAAPGSVQPPSIIDTAQGREHLGRAGAVPRASVSAPPHDFAPPPPSAAAAERGYGVHPGQHFDAPPAAGFADAFGSSDALHPPLQTSSAAQRLLDEPEPGNPRSGAYRTRPGSRAPAAPAPQARPIMANPYGTADGVVPADIFARVQAARREAGDSLRPTAFDDDIGSYEGARSSRGIGPSSLLLVAALTVAFFGYRHWSEPPEPVLPAEPSTHHAAGAPEPSLEPSAESERAEPEPGLPQEPRALPSAGSDPQPTMAPLQQEPPAATAPQVQPLAPSEPSPVLQAAPDRAPSIRRAPSKRASARAAAREAREQSSSASSRPEPAPRPSRAEPAPRPSRPSAPPAEGLPDNPY